MTLVHELLLAAALIAPASPTVHVMLHVPLAGARLAAYRHDLLRYGSVTDHIGSGTWTNGGDPNAPIVSERVDHIELLTTLRTARSLLPTFLRLQRIEQNQHETLAEIFGGAYGTAQQTRTRIVVRLPIGEATPPRLQRLHRIFANDGDGGDTTYPDRDSVVDYSGVVPAAAPRIEYRLRAAGFRFATEHETFITDDGPTR